MEKYFANHTLSEQIHSLGFNQPCLASWNYYTNEINYNAPPSDFRSEDVIQLPTYEQVFDFFKEHFGFYACINYNYCRDIEYKVHYGLYSFFAEKCESSEEAKAKCVVKLIELANKKLIKGNK